MVIGSVWLFSVFSFSCVQRKSNNICASFFGKPLLKGVMLTWYCNKQAQLSPERKRFPLQWWQQTYSSGYCHTDASTDFRIFTLPAFIPFTSFSKHNLLSWTRPWAINKFIVWLKALKPHTEYPQNTSTLQCWSIFLLNHMIWRTCCAPLRSCGMTSDY